MEYFKYIKSIRGRLITFVYIIIVFIYIINTVYFNPFQEIDSTSIFFLSYSPEISMEYYILLLWFLPIWIYQFYIYITQTEFSRQYSEIIIAKTSSKKNFLNKMFSSFFLVFLILLLLSIISLIFSFIMAYTSGISIDINLETGQVLFPNFPIISLLTCYIIFAFCGGMLATVLNTLTFLFKDVKLTLSLGILFWYFFVSSSKFNVMILIQPFILNEYSIRYKVLTLLVFVLSSIIINILGYLIIIRSDNV